MYIMNAMCNEIINSEFVERFHVEDKGDAALLIASYSDTRRPVTMGRYKTEKEAIDALMDMYAALYGGQTGYIMPESRYYAEEFIKKDARQKRKGGS